MPVAVLRNRLRKLWNARFAFLRWPVDIYRERVVAMRNTGFFSHRAGSTSYPIRAARYWWVLCALIDEARGKQRRIKIADVGCSKGFMKDFTVGVPDAEWVGLDMKIDHDALKRCGYHEAHQCDFDRPLPLPDHSVDVVVFLHVIEHLPRPSFTMRELSRILRPGGLLLTGSPVAPGLIAWARERQLRSRLRKGTVKAGGHINSMDCPRWRALVENSDLDLEMLTGTFLARWSGNPLENHAWWLRLNQLWGALFPSLGGEVYIAARKPAAIARLAPVAARGVLTPSMWKTGLAFGFVLAVAFSAFFFSDALLGRKCLVASMIAAHQDGNDTFYAVRHPAMANAVRHKIVIEVFNPQDVIESADVSRRHGKDAYYFIPWDRLPSFSQVARDLDLRVDENLVVDGVKFVLLSTETHGVSSDMRLPD